MVESFSMIAFITLVRHEIDDAERDGHIGDHDRAERDALALVEPSEAAFPEGRAFFYVAAVHDVQTFFKNGPYEQQTDCVRTHESECDERISHISVR